MIYRVKQRYFSNGRISSQILTLPENAPKTSVSYGKEFDEYQDDFTDYKEAERFHKGIKNA